MNVKSKLLLLLAIISISAQGGTMTSEISQQVYRDFAMNRGAFKVGNENMVIVRKDGKKTKLNFSMPDFGSTDSIGVGTLIDPSYVAGVKHNRGYNYVTYGQGAGHTYRLVDRNEHSRWDKHAPRLNKLVTDVAPSNLSADPKVSDYEVFVRVGSGTQKVKGLEGKEEWVSGAYNFLTGGIIPADKMMGNWIVYDQGGNFNGNILNGSPLPISINGGDSGSPLWGLNKKTGKWEIVAFAVAVSTNVSYYGAFGSDFLIEKQKEDTLTFDTKGSQEIAFGATKNYNNNKGTGIISQGDNKLEYTALKSDLALDKATIDELNYAKHVVFQGEDGTIKVENNINQGAGKLQFKGNYRVTSDDKNTTWVGAGLQIDKDKEVVWELKGVKGDFLHKIGEGTLHVKGTGNNSGDLNVGEGLVILDQQADENGQKQAFNKIDIVSGRATVRLTDGQQISMDNIHFGYRGGRVDLYGNEITAGDIDSTDYGAQIVNQNKEKKVVLNIDSNRFKKENSIFHGTFGETDSTKVNGKMDINIVGDSKKTFAVSGGANLDGDINLNNKNGKLVLEGARDLHAGENIKNTTVNGDYVTSVYKVNNINMSEGSEFEGGIYSYIQGNINTTGDNKVLIGYVPEKSSYVYDGNQQVWGNGRDANKVALNDNKFKDMTTLVKGDINITNNSSIDVGYANIEGNVNIKNNSNGNFYDSIIDGKIDADGTSKVKMVNSLVYSSKQESSHIKNLELDNSTIVFNNVENKTPKRRSRRAVENMYVETMSGNGKLAFVGEASEGATPLVIGNVGDKGLNLDIDAKSFTLASPYGKKFSLFSIENYDEGLRRLINANVNEEELDFGALRGKATFENNELGNRLDYKIKVPNAKGGINKTTASNLSNVALSNFAAKTSVIKSQKSLVDESLEKMTKDDFISGFAYKGNYSDAHYESNLFRKYHQTILNNGFSYETKHILNPNWELYSGVSFLYGKSDVNYKGAYNGKIESYSGNIYGKAKNKDGIFVKGLFGVSYLKDKINDSKNNSHTFTVGTGLGYEQKIWDLDFTMETNFNIYHIPSSKYQLKDKKGESYKVENKESNILEINPELKVRKLINLEKSKVSLYAGVGYEYNTYLNNDGAKVVVDNVMGKTGIIENGASIKTGIDYTISNVTIGGNVKYLTGKDSSKKLTGEVKLEVKF